MGLDFFNNLKENLEKNDTSSKITEGISDFIGELSEALQKSVTGKGMGIVSEIASNHKLTIASENSIIKTRNEIIKEYANSTKEEGALYFIINKIEGEDRYKAWQFSGNKRTQIEINANDLPSDANVNSIMRIKDGKLITDSEATKTVINDIKEKADEIIEKQDKKIEEYKKEGHTYIVTEDSNGRIFLWDSTEKPTYEIEDIYFPEELKDKAKEGNSFIYQNGTYIHIS